MQEECGAGVSYILRIDIIQLLKLNTNTASLPIVQCSATMTFLINGVDIGHCVATYSCGETDALLRLTLRSNKLTHCLHN